MSSGLYGIKHTNRAPQDHWGKNCFNSSFPTSIACYMLENNIPAIYVHLEEVDGNLQVVNSVIPISEVFRCGDRTSDELRFDFESIYEPYQRYSFDQIDGIDLVVKDVEGNPLAPIEIKLTVLPTSATSSLPEERWGCEIVVRSATTSYAALGMYDSVKDYSREVRAILEDACSSIQMWDNDFEMTHKIDSIAKSLDVFQRQFYRHQKPLVVQAPWKTQGLSPLLCEDAFDLVVWSDYAFSRLFIDDSYGGNASTMSRPMRATARLARCLWELSKSGKIRIVDIYRQMAFGNQTDKEFAVGGQKWRRYVTSDRIVRPVLPSGVIEEILEPGSIHNLSPERRLDQTLYFTVSF